jgi:hypothetical protein
LLAFRKFIPYLTRDSLGIIIETLCNPQAADAEDKDQTEDMEITEEGSEDEMEEAEEEHEEEHENHHHSDESEDDESDEELFDDDQMEEADAAIIETLKGLKEQDVAAKSESCFFIFLTVFFR